MNPIADWAIADWRALACMCAVHDCLSRARRSRSLFYNIITRTSSIYRYQRARTPKSWRRIRALPRHAPTTSPRFVRVRAARISPHPTQGDVSSCHVRSKEPTRANIALLHESSSHRQAPLARSDRDEREPCDDSDALLRLSVASAPCKHYRVCGSQPALYLSAQGMHVGRVQGCPGVPSSCD